MKTLVFLSAIMLSACNPFPQVKEAIEAKKTSDSILNEFNKVNDRLKELTRDQRSINDSIYNELARKFKDTIQN